MITPKRLEELFDKIEREPNTGCWFWMGALDRDGYARATVGSKKWCGIHREMWMHEFQAELTPTIHLDHICRERSCVNPRHLRPCTSRENTFAPGSMAVGALLAARTHCNNGHEFTPENT